MSTLALVCFVVAISDGDTLTARCDAQHGQPAATIRVRLAEIDAPEKGQPFGTRSRERLGAVCFNKAATIAPLPKGRTDRYGRTVARVTCAGIDANAAQVGAGMAWVFDRYAADQALYGLQDDARSAGRGLWTDRNAIAPWVWRQSNRSRAARAGA